MYTLDYKHIYIYYKLDFPAAFDIYRSWIGHGPRPPAAAGYICQWSPTWVEAAKRGGKSYAFRMLSSLKLMICDTLYIYIFICMYVCMYVSIYLSVCLSIYLSTYLSIYLSINKYKYIYINIHVYIYMRLCEYN